MQDKPSRLNDRRSDAALLKRYLGHTFRAGWGKTMRAWEGASPRTYFPTQRVYHKLRPEPEQGGPRDDLPPAGTVLELEGVRIRVDERLSPRQVRKLVEGRHTRHERGLILEQLRADDVVMELGGGIGMLSAAIALKIGGDRVHTYEANPELEPLIHDNHQLNAVQPHVKLCMLGREAGVRTFHISRNFSHSNAYVADETTHPVEVPVEPLNEQIARVQPTVMIFDVQGAEGELLEFADLSTVRVLLVEVHPAHLGFRGTLGLRRRLRRAGFDEVSRQGQSFLYRR